MFRHYLRLFCGIRFFQLFVELNLFEIIAKTKFRRVLLNASAAFFVLILTQTIAAQVPSPKDVLGFHPTDDRSIADWNQITNYFAKLDAASGRVKVVEIGKTTLGKPQIAAFISSEVNIKNLKDIQDKNFSVTHNTARYKPTDNPPAGAKTIVAISCSIHSTEIVASQMSMNLAFQLATEKSESTLEILDNTVLILIPSANPDGIDIVADWYRKTLGTKYEGSSPPELYHHYAGHDNNRDWFMMNLAETRNITKLFWKEWFPQIVYDVHQQGSNGSRMTIPPFFDPPNPRIPSLLLREIGLAGYKMASDLSRIGEKGVATNATYDTWWHGGFRSAPYYHNSIGILSEAASASLMTPVEITRDQLLKQRPTRGLKNPLETSTSFPDVWEGGTWGPADIARIEMTAARSLLELAAKFRVRYLQNSRKLAGPRPRNPDDPIGFVIPAGQPNEERVSRLIEILMWQGVEVRFMKEELEAVVQQDEPDRFTEVPGGSFIVLVNQQQSNNVLSLFERQIYPHRVNDAGEAEVPYDVSGWTLPLQMGVETIELWNIKDFEGDYHEVNEKFLQINDINLARKTLNLKPVKTEFAKLPNPLKTRPRIGLYKGFVDSMDEGWTRLVFDNHQIPYKSVSDADFKNNNLNYDVIVFPSQTEKEIIKGNSVESYPEEFAGGITEAGAANLKAFVTGGGKVICFDDSCELMISRFELGMKDVLKPLNRTQFHCPGSILEIELDKSNSIAKGMKSKIPAYFIYSSAYEITDREKISSVAKYGSDDILLSGWIYGEEFLNGKTAIAETGFGRGKIVLFGFRPQHRGQTYGTFPLIFNALEK